MSRDTLLMMAIARGALFTAGGLLAVPLALQAGYGGINLVVVALVASLAPGAVVCWVKGSRAEGERP